MARFNYGSPLGTRQPLYRKGLYGRGDKPTPQQMAGQASTDAEKKAMMKRRDEMMAKAKLTKGKGRPVKMMSPEDRKKMMNLRETKYKASAQSSSTQETLGPNPAGMGPRQRTELSVKRVGLEETKKRQAENTKLTAAAKRPRTGVAGGNP